MTTIRIHRRVAVVRRCDRAVPPDLPRHGGRPERRPDNAPVAITFTKWGAPPPAMPPTPFFGLFEGFSGDGGPRLVRGGGALAATERQRARHRARGHVRGRGRRPFVQRAHPGRDESAGAALLEGVILAGGAPARGCRSSSSRIPRLSGRPSCEGAPAEQDVFRGHHPRRARPTGLNRAGATSVAGLLKAAQPVSARATSAPRTSVRRRPCWPVSRSGPRRSL